jgi:hypothetical protein
MDRTVTENARTDETIVCHRMGIVVAEVTRGVEEKAEQQTRQAKIIADELVKVADGLAAWQAEVVPVDQLIGPDAAVELNDEACIGDALGRFADALKNMRATRKAALRDAIGGPENYDALLSRIRRFHEWFFARMTDLRTKAETFGTRFEADLAADADRQREIANEWSVVDADGLG